jgi:hypothetical protein
MALTAGQQAAIDRMNSGSTSVLDEEENQSGLTQGQRDAIERMKQRGPAPAPQQDNDDDAGSFDPLANYKQMYNMTIGTASAIPKAAGALVGLGTYVKGLNKIADPVAEGLYAAGDFIDNTLMTQDQLDKKTQLQTELQNAVQNMPPFPEDASLVDRIKFVSSYVINQGGAAGAFLKENPSQIANFVAETIPHIVLGGTVGKGAKAVAVASSGVVKPTSLIGRGLERAANASAATYGALGEGVIAAGDVGAGTAIEQRAQGNFDYSADRLYGLLALPTTALIGRTGGRFSGIADADTLATGLATNAAKDLVKLGGIKKVAKGAVVEAGEEFLQSGSEQIFSNLANDKPFYQDVGSSSVIGAATGAGLGAGVNTASALSAGPSNSGTELDSSAIIEEAPSTEALIAEADAQNEAELEQADQQADVDSAARDAAAPSFTPYEEFVKARVGQVDAQNELDIGDPNSKISAAFQAHLKAYRATATTVELAESYGEKGLNKIKTKFLKDVKEGNTDTEADAAAYLEALDKHAAEVAALPQDPAAIAARERQAIIDTPARTNSKAIEKAEALYGKDWVNSGQYDELAAVVNGGKFRQKTFDAAVDKIENPPIDVNALTTSREQKLEAVRQAVRKVTEGLTGKNDKAVFKTFSEAIFNFEGDKYLEKRVLANKKDGTGATSFTQLAKDAGVKDASSAKTVLKRIGPKLADALGITMEQLPALLASLRAANNVSAQDGDTAELDQQSVVEEQTDAVAQEPGDNVASDGNEAANRVGDGRIDQDEFTDPNEQLDKAELGVGGSFGTKASANQGAYDGVSQQEKKFTESRSNEANEVNEERVEAAKVNYEAQRKAMIAEFGVIALKMWRDGVSEGGPSFGQISTIDQGDWVGSVMEHASTNDDAQLAEDLRNIETLYDAANDGVTMENTDVQTNKEDEASGPDTSTQGSEGGGVETRSSGNTDAEPRRTAKPATAKPATAKPAPKIANRVTAEDILAKNPDMTPEQAQTNATAINGQLAVSKPKSFSKKRTITNATTTSNLQVVADGLFEDFVAMNDKDSVELTVEPGGIYSPIQIHATAKDAVRALKGSVKLSELKSAQAVIDPRDGKRAHFIAENINVGTEAAVIAHEVGVHLGLENNFLSKKEVVALSQEVNKWSNLDETAVERQIHDAVVGRIAFARMNGMVEEQVPIEIIAYAVEEAVLRGVSPSKVEVDNAAGWLSKVQDFFSELTSRWFSSKNEAVFKASELVALAQGAAQSAMEQVAVEKGAASNQEKDIVSYYGGLAPTEVPADAVLLERLEDENGQEVFSWGKDSKFGAQTNIKTAAFFDENGTMDMEVFSDELNGPIVSVNLEAASYTDTGNPVPNVYMLSIYGPDSILFSIPEDFDITKTKDVDGANWVRLEGVRHRDVVRLLTEARRRLTRRNNGRIPNITFNRVTGAAASTTETGRVGARTDEQLFKRFSFKDQTSIPAVKKKANREWVRDNMGGDGAVNIYDNTVEIAKQAASSLKFVHNIVRDVRKDMPSVGKWWDAMIAADVTRSEIKQSFSDVQKQVRALKKGRLETVNKFLGDSTFNQKWGYDPQSYHPDLFAAKKVKIDKVAQVQFNRLSKTEKTLVADIFAHGERMRQRKVALLKQLGITAKFFQDSSMEGPYAPLKRFGNNVAELKSARYMAAERAASAEGATKAQKALFEKLKSDGDHYVISFFDTYGAATAFIDQNKKTFAFGVSTKRRPSLEQDRVSNPEVYEKVMAALAASNNSDMDSKSKTAFREMVLDMYFQSMDERSARTSGARRLNRAGYDKNMVRGFLNHARSEASLIAQMENGTEINTALAEAGKEVKVNGNTDEERQRVLNTITSHYQKILTRSDTPIQDRIATANSVYMLLTSAGYHLTNATQPTMVTVPRIAGDFNDYSGTWSALFRGYKVALSASKIGLNLETEISFDKVPVKYHSLLKELQDRQILDQGMEEDGAFDRFNTGWEGLNKASDVLGTITRKLYNAAKFVESQNRISSAIAAYDMALSNPTANPSKTLNNSPEGRAQQYAIDVVEDTQGNFSELDAPLLIKQLSSVKLAVQYRKYQLLMAWHYTNAFNEAFRSETKETKAAGKRVLGYSLVHAAMGAGAVGVPGSSLAFWVATLLMGGEEEPKDLERWIKENIDDGLLGDVLSKGVFTTIGLDLTTKLSQDKIMSPLPYVDLTPGASGASDLVMGLAGPFGTTATNFFRSWEYFAQGDMLKGVEYLVPKGIRTAVESYRLGTEGLTTKSGVTLVDPTQFDVKSLLINALGLPATEINRVKWTRGQQYELEQYFSTASSRIRKDYIEATKARDRDGQAAAREAFRENEKAKDRVRPFFNNTRGVLARQSMSVLMKAPRNRSRLERREQNKLK